MAINPETELKVIEAAAVAIRGLIESRHETVEPFFSRIVRSALDEVIDGPRTGRWSLDQLTPEEKKYVGTKVEIIARTELGIHEGSQLDAELAGQQFDIKWSKTCEWMIGPENVGELVLGIGTNDKLSKFSVGLFIPFADRLRAGVNRDTKKSLTAASRKAFVHWLVNEATLPPNFLAALSDEQRAQIFAEGSAEARVRKLASLLPRTPIPRDAFRTVALDKDDPMRRLRRDKGKGETLGGMRLLSSRYGKEAAAALGLPPIPPNHWVAVSVDELRAAGIVDEE